MTALSSRAAWLALADLVGAAQLRLAGQLACLLACLLAWDVISLLQ
jgi:hypothetical protein